MKQFQKCLVFILMALTLWSNNSHSQASQAFTELFNAANTVTHPGIPY
jgi:hypothetical protein